jgi:hypothetical protein
MIAATLFTTVKNIFAVVGATGTVAGLAWRIYTWRHDHRQHVEVKIANVLPVYGPRVGDWAINVTAINHGDRPVEVTSAGFRLPDGRTLVIVNKPFPDALPCTVPARDSRQTWTTHEELDRTGENLEGVPLVGFVNLSTDERFETKPKVLIGANSEQQAA